ncbi:MAG: cation:proton antiporter [Mycobacteriales bacterium]
MDQFLFHLAVVLVAALIAAEISERIGLPTVVGEILAGILIGPSVLTLIGHDEILQGLAELGVIVLLLEVGLQMDLRELAAVGRKAMLVAFVGVALPFAGGYGVAAALGQQQMTAIFLGAALTATSVGITARVFGDLRALTSVEARTVLGAAVADDVLGLVVLTVVVRVATGGAVTANLVLSTIGLAIGFLLVVGGGAIYLIPKLADWVESRSRSAATMLVLALMLTFAVARLASAAKLAPVVGAFVAGLALARCRNADHIRRELTPIAHLFIPVFFLLIGVQVRLSEIARPSVLLLAGALLVVAAVGKIAAGYVVGRSSGDRLLVGLGMLPRGEVGLIFATIGLQQGILGADVYGALLIVVLATTLITPPVLRLRLVKVRAARKAAKPEPKPAAGWLGEREGIVDLAATPPDHELLHVVLRAARLCASASPGERLLRWVSDEVETPVRWDSTATKELFEVLREGDARSWRLLEVTGILERALPELAESLARRRNDATELDPVSALRWRLVESVRRVVIRDERARPAFASLEHPDWLLLAALVIDSAGFGPAGVIAARKLTQRLGLGAAAEQHVAALVADRDLLLGSTGRFDGLAEESVLELAVHLHTLERATALYIVSVASDDDEPGRRGRLDVLFQLIREALRNPELTSRSARNHVQERRASAMRLAEKKSPAARRIHNAPQGYLLRQEPATVAHQATLLDPMPRRGTVRIDVAPVVEGEWRIDVVTRDTPGLLAHITGSLAELHLDIAAADIATWSDGLALESFVVRAQSVPPVAELAEVIGAGLHADRPTAGVVQVNVQYDDVSSPWYTMCEIAAPDRPGLLHSIAAAFASVGANVHTARASTMNDIAHDTFAVTDKRGEKLDDATKERLERALRFGVRPGRQRFRRVSHTLATTPKHAGHSVETAAP